MSGAGKVKGLSLPRKSEGTGDSPINTMDRRQIQEFISGLQENREAFDLFKYEATKKGLLK